jgi:hypothetical protein
MSEEQRERRVRLASWVGATIVLLGIALYFVYGDDTRPQWYSAGGSTTTQTP